MKSSRPKNLNLFTIHFPIPAIISILHRITGFILVLLIPCIIWFLSYSLTADGFQNLTTQLSTPWVKLIFWLLFIPFCFHLTAGLRHLLSDIHLGDSLRGGRLTAYATFVITLILIILTGIWLW